MIDLRSDTVTQPSQGMREAMLDAAVGDDVYGEDPTVNLLEQTLAQRLGKPAALFLPTGTQANLVALLTHCNRGDEYIVGQSAHTYRFEGGGAAALGSIQPQPITASADGSLDLSEVKDHIKPDDFHFAKTVLLCLENTTDGKVLELNYLRKARHLCNAHGLKLHLDGARFFNAVVDSGESSADMALPFDSVSVCLSKGLGAPVGSVLVGTEQFIVQARRWRKVVGGGMRQAGFLAMAGLYALEHNLERLTEDHVHAHHVAQFLKKRFGDTAVSQATNMIHLNLSARTIDDLAAHLRQHDILAPRARWVFHLNIGASDVDQITHAIEQF